MPIGRPSKSKIRENISEILYIIGESYGYNIFRIYNSVFSPVSLRSIYYHLNKGVKLGEFKITKVEDEKGDYSWGGEAKRIYYSLGVNSSPKLNIKVKNFIDKQNISTKSS